MSAARPPLPQQIASRIKLVIFDVDGVLTDAAVYVGLTGSGEPIELKRFDIQDGLGLKMLQRAGLEVAIVSGRISGATDVRARELGIDCYQVEDGHKLPAVRDLLTRLGIGWDEVAMLADDLPDLAVLRLVGLPAAVANAVPHVAEVALWRSGARGGEGAAREFCDALLDARGELEGVVRRYVEERSGS